MNDDFISLVGGWSFWPEHKQRNMSEQLMAFNNHSHCEATERWVPFNPAVLKKIGEYTPFHDSLILL